MKTPSFWYPPDGRASLTANLLTPLGWLYGAATQTRVSFGNSKRVGAHVVCMGNLTAGGTGKTPLSIAVHDILTAVGKRTAFLTRGYGARVEDPTLVDPMAHSFRDVGDEPMLLAARGATYVSPGRVKGAEAATRDGVDVLVMDDGFQNPAVRKDISFVVVDGAVGFGNRRMIPAGPLRESIHLGLRRADAVLILGDLRDGPAQDLIAKSGKPVFQAHVKPDTRDLPSSDHPVVAFSGIGRPEKFFDTVRGLGLTIAEAVPYPDHHPFNEKEIEWLKTLAAERGAQLVTTSKDFVRLPDEVKTLVQQIPIRAHFDEPEEVESFLHHMLSEA